MAISILLYAGLALLALGSVSFAHPLRFLGIATRGVALVVLGTGLAAAAVETSRRFAALSAPGYAKAAMNFRVEPRFDGSCRVTTETRIFATDPKSARRFATYWRFIYPGSALIRRMWLDAIAAHAEGEP